MAAWQRRGEEEIVMTSMDAAQQRLVAPNPAHAPLLHHIGVQTFDLANSICWYRDFFGCQPSWSTDNFSELTRCRLPGIVRMTEVAVGSVRFHLFERDRRRDRQAYPSEIQFQHVCLAAETPAELRIWRQRWIGLFESRRYVFLQPECPTGIVVDDAGTESFYCFDVNGLEFEFTYIPEREQ
jgi:catechol 2,3-dioxygenase-like lactoylglutathione lyase family enzyme